MDRATPAGRAQAFEEALAALNCAPARRNARVVLKLDESRGGLFGSVLADRLRQAGMKVGQAGDYVVRGTISAQSQAHRLLRVNEVVLNAAVALFNAAGRQVASSISREESYASSDIDATYQELVQAQATDAASQLVTQLCQ